MRRIYRGLRKDMWGKFITGRKVSTKDIFYYVRKNAYTTKSHKLLNIFLHISNSDLDGFYKRCFTKYIFEAVFNRIIMHHKIEKINENKEQRDFSNYESCFYSFCCYAQQKHYLYNKLISRIKEKQSKKNSFFVYLKLPFFFNFLIFKKNEKDFLLEKIIEVIKIDRKSSLHFFLNVFSRNLSYIKDKILLALLKNLTDISTENAIYTPSNQYIIRFMFSYFLFYMRCVLNLNIKCELGTIYVMFDKRARNEKFDCCKNDKKESKMSMQNNFLDFSKAIDKDFTFISKRIIDSNFTFVDFLTKQKAVTNLLSLKFDDDIKHVCTGETEAGQSFAAIFPKFFWVVHQQIVVDINRLSDECCNKFSYSDIPLLLIMLSLLNVYNKNILQISSSLLWKNSSIFSITELLSLLVSFVHYKIPHSFLAQAYKIIGDELEYRIEEMSVLDKILALTKFSEVKILHESFTNTVVHSIVDDILSKDFIYKKTCFPPTFFNNYFPCFFNKTIYNNGILKDFLNFYTKTILLGEMHRFPQIYLSYFCNSRLNGKGSKKRISLSCSKNLSRKQVKILQASKHILIGKKSKMKYENYISFLICSIFGVFHKLNFYNEHFINVIINKNIKNNYFTLQNVLSFFSTSSTSYLPLNLCTSSDDELFCRNLNKINFSFCSSEKLVECLISLSMCNYFVSSFFIFFLTKILSEKLLNITYYLQNKLLVSLSKFPQGVVCTDLFNFLKRKKTSGKNFFPTSIFFENNNKNELHLNNKVLYSEEKSKNYIVKLSTVEIPQFLLSFFIHANPPIIILSSCSIFDASKFLFSTYLTSTSIYSHFKLYKFTFFIMLWRLLKAIRNSFFKAKMNVNYKSMKSITQVMPQFLLNLSSLSKDFCFLSSSLQDDVLVSLKHPKWSLCNSFDLHKKEYFSDIYKNDFLYCNYLHILCFLNYSNEDFKEKIKAKIFKHMDFNIEARESDLFQEEYTDTELEAILNQSYISLLHFFHITLFPCIFNHFNYRRTDGKKLFFYDSNHQICNNEGSYGSYIQDTHGLSEICEIVNDGKRINKINQFILKDINNKNENDEIINFGEPKSNVLYMDTNNINEKFPYFIKSSSSHIILKTFYLLNDAKSDKRVFNEPIYCENVQKKLKNKNYLYIHSKKDLLLNLDLQFIKHLYNLTNIITEAFDQKFNISPYDQNLITYKEQPKLLKKEIKNSVKNQKEKKKKKDNEQTVEGAINIKIRDSKRSKFQNEVEIFLNHVLAEDPHIKAKANRSIEILREEAVGPYILDLYLPFLVQ